MSVRVCARVGIVGTRPLLFHCFTPESIPLERKERTGVAGHDPEEWKRTYSATKDGQLYLHSRYIFGCLRNGAKYIQKKGRATYQVDFAATTQVQDDKVLLNRFIPADQKLPYDDTEDVFIDVSSVVNPGTRGRNVRYRVGISKGWEATFNILWDPTLVPKDMMRKICDEAGILVGLADGRNIGYGRFDVVSFEVSDYPKKSPA
jgi:hypothetical protein